MVAHLLGPSTLNAMKDSTVTVDSIRTDDSRQRLAEPPFLGRLTASAAPGQESIKSQLDRHLHTERSELQTKDCMEEEAIHMPRCEKPYGILACAKAGSSA